MKRLSLLILIYLAGTVSAGWSLAPKPAPAHRMAAVRVGDDPSPQPSPQPAPEPPRPAPAPDVRPYVALPASLTVPAGGWLSIDAETNCREVKFKSPDTGLNLFPEGKLADPFGTVVSSLVPGQYRIMAFAAMADVPAVSDWCIITVTGAQPPPGPGPGPGPGPTPPPAPVTAAKLWIITVDDATARTQATAAVLGQTAAWREFTTAGHSYRQLNKTTPEAAAFTKFTSQVKGPCLILMDADTKKVLNNTPADLALPATMDGVKALVAKYTGGK